MVKLTDKNFDDEVINYNGNMVVDFYADWCGPCKMMGPIIEELSNELDSIKFAKLNVDESSVSSRFGIMSIPTILVFKSGKEIDRVVGLINKEQLKNLILKRLDI